MSEEKKKALSAEEAEFAEAEALAETSPDKAVAKLQKLLSAKASKTDNEIVLKVKEDSIYSLGKIYVQQGNTAKLKSLLVEIRPFFKTIPKARTAKIVKTLIEQMADPKIPVAFQISVCEEAIEWCTVEKRKFLKQRLQSRMARLMYHMGKYKEALTLISKLVKEVKKVDNKLLLIEIFLTGSKTHAQLKNIPKAKGDLTAARTNANATNCPPRLQAEIDKQAGILCAEEEDFKTGFSYFYESFEGFNTLNNKEEAVISFKYMLLSKIMMGSADEVKALTESKSGLKYAGRQIDSMKAVAKAYKKKSIHAFEEVYQQYPKELGDDEMINRHLGDLRNRMLENNLKAIIEPFSHVQIPHVAKLINLPVEQVEAKLSQMILDGNLKGILDQGSGDLILFEEAEADKTAQNALETVKEMSTAVDKLFVKAKRLT